MNRLTTKERTSAITCLVEGNSQRATCRMTGLAKKTVSRLAVELGIRRCCGKTFTSIKAFTNHRRWCNGKMSRDSFKGMNSSAQNGQWKGDDVGYGALHEWIRLHLPEPTECSECGGSKRLDLANISQEYKRDLSDWEWLCRKCHMMKDGRMERFTRLFPKH